MLSVLPLACHLRLKHGAVIADANRTGIVVSIAQGPVPYIVCGYPNPDHPEDVPTGVTFPVHPAAPFYAVVDVPPAVLVGPAFVLPPETAAFLCTPRVLAHRVCCGWNWVDSQEAFVTTRLNGPCDVFHTPNHELILEQISHPNSAWATAEAEFDWERVIKALETP